MRVQILSAALMLLPFAALTQPSRTDTVCLPAAQLRLALQKIEKGKLDASLLKIQQNQNLLQQQDLILRDSIIQIQKKTIVNYQRITSGYEQEKNLLENKIVQSSHALSRQKRKTVVSSIGTALLAALAGYLLSK